MDDYFPLIGMLLLFVFFLYLAENHARDDDIVDCATEGAIKRPTIPPEHCQDLIPPTCNALFVKTPDTYTNNRNPYVYFPFRILLIFTNFVFNPIRYSSNIWDNYILARCRIKWVNNAWRTPSLRLLFHSARVHVQNVV